MNAEFGQAALTMPAAAFHTSWEGALIVGAVWLGLRCLPKLGAATRYAIWLCTLVALVLIPVLTVGLSQEPADPAIDPAATGTHIIALVDAPVAQPQTETGP